MSKAASPRHESPSRTQAATPASRKPARILEAASSCFAEKGFKRATVEDIAAAAGVSRPLVYKHFGDKDTLIDAVLEATFDDWLVYNATPFEDSAESASAEKTSVMLDVSKVMPGGNQEVLSAYKHAANSLSSDSDYRRVMDAIL